MVVYYFISMTDVQQKIIHKNTKSFINKERNSSTKSTRDVEANVNTRKENQDFQNSSNEVKDVLLKGHPLSQIS